MLGLLRKYRYQFEFSSILFRNTVKWELITFSVIALTTFFTHLIKYFFSTADIRSQIERIRYEANEFKYNNGNFLLSDVFE